MKRVSILFTVTMLLLATLSSKEQSPACLRETDWNKLRPHPRLFADNERLKSLKNQKDSVSAQLIVLLRYQAEEALTADKIIYPEKGFKFSAVRTAQGRILPLALAYRITGDKRYFVRARQELMQLAALPDWCPGHFLDVGEAAMVAGTGLDWLHNDLTEEDRIKITSAIVNNALIPSLSVSESESGWMKGDFNWTQVCHGGLTVGALAIAEREPKLARRIVERAINYLPYAGAAYAPDGTYAEGPGYWSYGTSYHVILVDALRSVFGTTCGLEKFPGFLKTPDFMAQMISPSGLNYNYSDSHLGRDASEPAMMWFARAIGKKDIAAEELGNIRRMQQSLPIHSDSSQKNTIRLSRHFALGVIWWNPLLPSTKAIDAPLHWTAKGKVSLGVLRSAWNDSNAVYIAVKGGTPNGSHAHMDEGSFVMEANGVRWAVDLGSESYDKMRAAKLDLWNYTQNSTRWTTFRAGPEAHNILRFDNGLQEVDGIAVVGALPFNEKYSGNEVDLLPLYKSNMLKVLRRVMLYKDRSILIEDEWKAGNKAISASWQWLTYADVTLVENGFLLKQSGKSLKLSVECSSGQNKVLTVEDVSQPVNKQDSPNPGLKRLVIRIPTAANASVTLKVKAVPGN